MFFAHRQSAISTTFERDSLPSLEVGGQRAVVDAAVPAERRGDRHEDSAEVERSSRAAVPARRRSDDVLEQAHVPRE